MSGTPDWIEVVDGWPRPLADAGLWLIDGGTTIGGLSLIGGFVQHRDVWTTMLWSPERHAGETFEAVQVPSPLLQDLYVGFTSWLWDQFPILGRQLYWDESGTWWFVEDSELELAFASGPEELRTALGDQRGEEPMHWGPSFRRNWTAEGSAEISTVASF